MFDPKNMAKKLHLLHTGKQLERLQNLASLTWNMRTITMPMPLIGRPIYYVITITMSYTVIISNSDQNFQLQHLEHISIVLKGSENEADISQVLYDSQITVNDFTSSG